MADSNVIEVKLRADASAFGSGAREAGAHVDSLLAHLKDFKSEAVSTGRQARFFAGELAEIIPGADGAKEALRNLITIGLGAGGIESLIGGAKLLVGAFHELTAEEDQARETFTKFLDDQKKSVDALNVSVEKMLLTMRGATRAQILEFEQTYDLLRQKKAKQDELTESQHKLEEAQTAAANADAMSAHGAALLVSVWEKEVDKIREQIAALDDLIGKKK